MMARNWFCMRPFPRAFDSKTSKTCSIAKWDQNLKNHKPIDDKLSWIVWALSPVVFHEPGKWISEAGLANCFKSVPQLLQMRFSISKYDKANFLLLGEKPHICITPTNTSITCLFVFLSNDICVKLKYCILMGKIKYKPARLGFCICQSPLK